MPASVDSAPVVLVTGAARRIGAAIARELHAAGCRLALHYRHSAADMQALCEELEAHRASSTLSLRADLADAAAAPALVEAAVARFGRLDALVNNAGVVDRKSRVEDMSLDRLTRMMRINVIGSILCAREAVKRMSTRNGGRGGVIVNISSIAAVLGAAGEYVDYAASKGAIDSFTVGLAREVAEEGIRVNAVRPGVTDTDIHASGGQPDRASRFAPLIPMKRPAAADEIARAVMFLLSDAASYATGAILDVTGGR